MQIGRYIRTLRHVSPSQLVARLGYNVRQVYYRNPLYGLSDHELPADYALRQTPPVIWRGDAGHGRMIHDGIWLLAGKEVALGCPPRDWFADEMVLLQKFNLHYHEWLADLAAAGEEKTAARIIDNWLEQYEFFHPIAWHPYPLSLRIVAWLRGWSARSKKELGESTSTVPFLADEQRFWRCLIRQVEHLSRNLEWGLGGNHIIKNIKALVMAGLCLPGMESLVLPALAELHRQVREQILIDGGHDERSPLYQAQVLQDLLEIKLLLRKVGGGVPAWLDETCRKMGAALMFYCHPDGGLALFNDSAEDAPLRLSRLIDLSGASDDDMPAALPASGYARLARGVLNLILDAGPVGPDQNPGHAHADTLSFELSVGAERLIVNCGTYAYQTPDRNVWRGTPAHSTVSIDGEDSAEVWATFRVGRRPKRVGFSRNQGSDDETLHAWHDGYRHLGARHERTLTMDNLGTRLTGTDVVHLNGPRRRVVAHFHLHPDVTAVQHSENEILLTTAHGKKLRFSVPQGRLDLRESRYAGQFGQIRTTRQIWLLGAARAGNRGSVVSMPWLLELVK